MAHADSTRPGDDMTMEEVMRRWPETLHTIIQFNMLCVGCPIAPFHTISDACHEHGVDEGAFRTALEKSTTSGT